MTHAMNLPYDSEMLEIEKVKQRLIQMQGQRMNPQDFVDRAVDLFAKIGFHADVRTYTTGAIEQKGNIEKVEEVPDLYTFEIEIVGRLDRHEFDHDKMSHEVQRNVLGLPGPEGKITEAGMDEIVRKYTKGHRH